jgi:hypothetical protein
MRDLSSKSSRKTLPSSGSATSSPALEAGLSPSGLPGGQTTAPSGPAPALASRSQWPVGVREPPIRGTYGPTFSDSSVPEVLGSSWENRLRERLGMLGSVEWGLIWKRKVMPGGRSIYRLAASGRHRSESGCTGWPTPKAAGAGPDYAKRQRSDTGMALPAIAAVAGWPTAASRDFRHPNLLPYQDRGGGRRGSNWPTWRLRWRGGQPPPTTTQGCGRGSMPREGRP